MATANDRLFVRYSYQRARVFDPGLYGPNGGIYGGPHNSGFQGTGPSRNQSPGLNYSRIFSPTLVMEFRFGIVGASNFKERADMGTVHADDWGTRDVLSVKVSEAFLIRFGMEWQRRSGRAPAPRRAFVQVAPLHAAKDARSLDHRSRGRIANASGARGASASLGGIGLASVVDGTRPCTTMGESGAERSRARSPPIRAMSFLSEGM